MNAEEEAMGEEHGGEWREEDGIGEEGGPARIDEDRPEEEEVGVKAEEEGRVCMEEPLPIEVSSADTGVGEDAGAILNGEEQGGAWTEEEEGRALTGEGERCLRLGLKAEGALLRSVSGPWLAIAALSTRLEVSKEGLEDGRLPEGRQGLARPVGDFEPFWFGSLEVTESTD